MNNAILCEGKTDAVLLSYYLGRTGGWENGKAPKGLSVDANEAHGESAYWYSRGEDSLLICGVGGKDKFGSFFADKLRSPLINSTVTFQRIAVVTDRDYRSIDEIQASIRSAFGEVFSDIRCGEWMTSTFIDGFGQERTVDFLLLVVPPAQEGALETLLLEAICENPYDKNIVESSIAYVDEVAPRAAKYIRTDRLRRKACLGVTWAIQSPEKVFSFIDEQIRSVQWEEYETLRECFSELIGI